MERKLKIPYPLRREFVKKLSLIPDVAKQEKARQGCIKCICNLFNAFQGRVLFAPLNLSNIGVMQSCFSCKDQIKTFKNQSTIIPIAL